jgi:hypothetical protein
LEPGYGNNRNGLGNPHADHLEGWGVRD